MEMISPHEFISMLEKAQIDKEAYNVIRKTYSIYLHNHMSMIIYDYIKTTSESVPLSSALYGYICECMGNVKTAEIFYNKAVDANNDIAMYELGVMNYLRKDFEKAAKLFQQAMSLGNSYAQYSLAFMYETGNGFPENKIKAMKMYLDCANNNHWPSLVRLDQISNESVN